MDGKRNRTQSEVLLANGCRKSAARERSRKLESPFRCNQPSNPISLGVTLMLSVRRLWLRLQTLFSRRRVVKELDDEIQFHLDQQISEYVAAGMDREQARHAAIR